MKRLLALIALVFLNIESAIININQINGPNNLVYYGRDNKINGRDNQVAGFDNNISGKRNVAQGDQNSLKGNGNLVSGYGSNIAGRGNLINGQGNVVLGPDSSQQDIDKMNQRMIGIFASRGFGGIVGFNITPNQNQYIGQYPVKDQYQVQTQKQPPIQTSIQIQTQHKTQQNSKTNTQVQILQQQDQQLAKNQQLIIAIDQGLGEVINAKKEQIMSEISLQAQDKNHNVQQQAKEAVQNFIPVIQQKKQTYSENQQIQKTDQDQNYAFRFVVSDNTDATAQQAPPSVNSSPSNESKQTRQIKVSQQSSQISESKNNQNNQKLLNNNQSEILISQQIQVILQPLKAIIIPIQFSAYGQYGVIIL